MQYQIINVLLFKITYTQDLKIRKLVPKFHNFTILFNWSFSTLSMDLQFNLHSLDYLDYLETQIREFEDNQNFNIIPLNFELEQFINTYNRKVMETSKDQE